MKFKNLAVAAGILSSTWFLACSSTKARMVEWKNDELTVCCKSKCGESDWNSAAGKVCSGEATLIGGQARDRISGFESKSQGDGKTNFTPKVREESCRIFKCNGTIKAEN